MLVGGGHLARGGSNAQETGSVTLPVRRDYIVFEVSWRSVFL